MLDFQTNDFTDIFVLDFLSVFILYPNWKKSQYFYIKNLKLLFVNLYILIITHFYDIIYLTLGQK